jgi:hypothetical protein
MRKIAWVSLAAVAMACGSGGNGNGNGGGAGGGPVCAKNTVQLSGMLDGAPASGAYTGPTPYAFAQLGPAGTVDFSFGTGGALHLQWMTLVADDQTEPATGTLTMPSEGPHPGQMYCVTAGTVTPRTMAEGDGISFTLTSLAKGACPGTGVSASLDGCASPSM